VTQYLPADRRIPAISAHASQRDFEQLFEAESHSTNEHAPRGNIRAFAAENRDELERRSKTVRI
jgi:hypothetical protein